VEYNNGGTYCGTESGLVVPATGSRKTKLPKNNKKKSLKNYVLKSWMISSWAGNFSCSLAILHGGLRRWCIFLIKICELNV
jgi:hypothetical protein